MGISCCAIKCSNRFKSGSGITFYRFPFANADLTNAWVHAIRRENFVPTKYHAVCSQHFTPDCFLKGYVNQRRLTDIAVPTEFDFSQAGDTSGSPPKRKRRNGKSVHLSNEERNEEDVPRKRKRAAPARKADHNKTETCCAFGCKERYMKDGPVTFHSFPLEAVARKAWSRAVGRANFVPDSSARLCSRHFPADCFAEDDPRRLRDDAVPAVFVSHVPRRKVLKILPDDADSDDGLAYSAPEFLMDNAPSIKEEPVDYDPLVDPLLTPPNPWLPDNQTTNKKRQMSPAETNPAKKPPPAVTDQAGDGRGSPPVLNMVFVKVEENWDETEMRTQHKISLVETPSPCDPFARRLDAADHATPPQQAKEPPPHPPVTIRVRSSSELEDELSSLPSSPARSVSDPLAGPLVDTPGLVLVGPLTHPEETLATLRKMLAEERADNARLRSELEAERAARVALRQRLRATELALRRLRDAAAPEDFAWSEA